MSEPQPPADAAKANDGTVAPEDQTSPLEDLTLDQLDSSFQFQPETSKVSDFMKVSQHGMTELVSGEFSQNRSDVVVVIR